MIVLVRLRKVTMSDTPPESKNSAPVPVDEASAMSRTRRDMLRVAIVATATAGVGSLGAIFPADAAAVDLNLNTDMPDFASLSGVLTGIDPGQLAPAADRSKAADPVDIGRDYFRWLQAEQPTIFGQLLQLYRLNRTLPPAALADLLLNKSGDDLRYLARSIILMWYLGAWYKPCDLKRLAKSQTPDQDVINFKVISAKAYTRGWVWRVAQAHPMGYSELSFGYWHNAPPGKESFFTVIKSA